MNQNLLELCNVSVEYAVQNGFLSAVDSVSFSIREGEIFAVVGESGCGKSTVASAIMRLLQEENVNIEGEILYKGRNLLKLSKKDMQKIRGAEIGMIFQNPLDSLNPVYRTGKQVEEALRQEGFSREEAKKRTLDLYRAVQIPDAERRMRSFPHELSGGMRQRVMISMMLARKPRLLIADEPTTALDVTIEAQILNLLRELRSENNTSIMVVTHNFGIVSEIADRVAVMYAGQLVELADVGEIFRNPQHPYTQALIGALPRRSKREGRISTIPGNVPRIIEKTQGCRFANRCAYATDACRAETPILTEISEGHFVKCQRSEKHE